MAPDVTAEVQSGVEGGQPGSTLVKNLSEKALRETPVQTYQDAAQVPDEFVIKDPTRIPTRTWGDKDPSRAALSDIELSVIDISPLITMDAGRHRPVDEEAAKKVVAEIGRACEEWGFFQAINHGIPESLLDHLLEIGHEFFNLPLEEKQKYSGGTEGYGRFDFNAKDRFWVDTMRHTVRPKLAPENDRVPDKPPAYRKHRLVKLHPGFLDLLQSNCTDLECIYRLQEGVEKLLHVLWTSLSEHLGLESTALQKAHDDDFSVVIRLNYYPTCPQPEKVAGAGEHKDFGSITVLLQDDVGGLQVQKPGSNMWVDVKPKKGSLVINIGNQLEMISNGKYNSTVHRVLVNRSKPRLSVGTFVNPTPNCIVRPLQELLDKTKEPPQFKQLVYRDYVPRAIEDYKAGVHPYLRYQINRD